jgi:hypothetical protein
VHTFATAKTQAVTKRPLLERRLATGDSAGSCPPRDPLNSRYARWQRSAAQRCSMLPRGHARHRMREATSHDTRHAANCEHNAAQNARPQVECPRAQCAHTNFYFGSQHGATKARASSFKEKRRRHQKSGGGGIMMIMRLDPHCRPAHAVPLPCHQWQRPAWRECRCLLTSAAKY